LLLGGVLVVRPNRALVRCRSTDTLLYVLGIPHGRSALHAVVRSSGLPRMAALLVCVLCATLLWVVQWGERPAGWLLCPCCCMLAVCEGVRERVDGTPWCAVTWRVDPQMQAVPGWASHEFAVTAACGRRRRQQHCAACQGGSSRCHHWAAVYPDRPLLYPHCCVSNDTVIPQCCCCLRATSCIGHFFYLFHWCGSCASMPRSRQGFVCPSLFHVGVCFSLFSRHRLSLVACHHRLSVCPSPCAPEAQLVFKLPQHLAGVVCRQTG
jgi:hypothetical protein